MGIQGLIPLLEKSWNTVNISQFSGCTVAIDAYCWLHKGVFTCAEKLARGEDNQAYVHYCMRFVTMLLAKNIKPILVFDGQRLPAKADTESKRRKIRDENRKKAAELLRLGKTNEASSLLRRSIDVTHKMALNLIKRCREINVDCIVAPYEADSQLAYLNISGIAHLIITEDSDLLLFGCKRVLFKMDQNGGGILIEQEKLYLSMNMPLEQFNFNKFRHMCILSGCDYLPSVPGVGLIKARQFITRISEPDIYKSLLRLGSFMNIKVPENYRDQFMDADRMFQYQPVYDPLSRQVKPLNEISDPNLLSLVSKLTPDKAYQLALGNIDPISLEVMDNWDPDARMITKNKINQARHQSIWSKDYQTSKFEPTSTLRPKIIKNVIQTSPKNSSHCTSPEPKKRLPVTEDDVLSTLEEIYTSEKIKENETKAKNNAQFKKSIPEKNNEIIDKHVLTPEIDDIIIENVTPNIFKQPTKRKYTVINPEKQVVSRYFSPQIPKSSEIAEDDEKEFINPFKCRKVVIPQQREDTIGDLNITSSSIHSIVEDDEKECINPFKCRQVINPQKGEDTSDDLNITSNSIHSIVEDDEKECINPFKCKKVAVSKKKEYTSDDLNTTSSFIHSVEENKTQDEKEDKKIIANTFQLKTPSSIHKAFCWNNYSNNTTKTTSKECNDINNEWISPNTQNDSSSINNDINKTDNDNDVDEGFYSQNSKESKITPKEKKRSCPRAGLSKNVVKKGQTLLSKFGFKTSEKLKR